MKGKLVGYRPPLPYLRIHLILLLYFCLYVKLSISNYYQMRKCCLSENISLDRSRVDCITEFDSNIELYSFSDIKDLQSYVIPKCDNLNDTVKIYLDGIKSDDLYKNRACLDIITGKSFPMELPILVYCHLNENNTAKVTNELSATITTIRRCCPRDMILDPRNKSCVPSRNPITEYQLSLINNDDDTMIDYLEDPFLSLLPIIKAKDFLAVKRGPPNCKSAIFDFHINSNDLIYDNGSFNATLISPNQEGFTKEEIKLMDNNSCVELTPESTISNGKLILRACYNERICSDKMCIRKCCPEDQLIIAGKHGCSKLNDETFNHVKFHQEILNMFGQKRKIFENGYGLLVGIPCGNRGMYFLGPDDNFSITSKGEIDVIDHKVFNHHEYCMETFLNVTNENFYTFICFEGAEEKDCLIRCNINTILQLISCAFLLMTLVVYACLPVLQNLHGKTLMCHVGSLFCAFCCLAVISWVTPEKNIVESVSTISCKVLGYAMLFSFLSAFSWLNVMCFDIWWTFGGSRGSTSTRRRGHKKRFLFYCAYAWGLACLITVIVIVVDHIRFLPLCLTPAIGLGSCWFTSGNDLHGELLFFIGPVTLLLIINIILFVITSINCNKVKAEIDKVIADPSDARNKRYQADRIRLMMNIKLFIVMGISWILEIISYFINNYATDWKWREEFFYLPDTFNCLQGLAIFVLFVIKKRVYYALRKRLGFENKRLSSNATTALHDVSKVNKSASNSTLMSTFQVSSTP